MSQIREMMDLVYVTDDGYLKPAAVSLASAYAWCSDPTRLIAHVVDIGISDQCWENWSARLKTTLPAGARIVRHKLPNSALDGFPKYRGRSSCCARAYIPDLMPDVEWCLYVDGDTLFFDDPLKTIDVFDSSFAFQAHRDWIDTASAEEAHRDWFEAHGMCWDIEQYGCSGVLLMNLKWFREHGVGQKLMDFMKRYQDSKWPDQDALYWVCRGYVKFLPDEWGMMDVHLWLSKGTVPSCLHYVERKPWNAQPLARGYWGDSDLSWINHALQLTDYSQVELLGEKSAYSRFANRWGWLWKLAFKVASLNNSWRLSHRYRMKWILPRCVKRHISCARLKKRLARGG